MKKNILLFLLLLLPVVSFSYEIHYEDYIKYSVPTWTPEGKIAFIKSVSNGRKYVYGEEDKDVSGIFKLWHQTESISSDTYLCTMNIDGTDKREVMKIPEKFNPGYISWGKEWVVISGGILDKNKNTIGKIAIARPTGKGFRFIGEGREASISPGGDKIVYADKGIWQMDTDGSNKVQLTDNPGDSHPLWSPDGTMVAFYREMGDRYDGVYTEMEKKYNGGYILDIETKEIKRVAVYGFISWSKNKENIWTAKGMIDLNGNLMKEYPEVPYGPLSPDDTRIVSDFHRDDFYVGDVVGNELYKIRAIQTIEHGKRNRKQKNNIWIKE